MSWLKKDKRKETPVKDAAARLIAGGIIHLQLKIAKALHQIEQRLTLRQKKLLLLVCCLSCTIYCGYILGDAVFRQASQKSVYPKPGGVPPVAQPPPHFPKDSLKRLSE